MRQIIIAFVIAIVTTGASLKTAEKPESGSEMRVWSVTDDTYLGIKPYEHNKWYWQYKGDPIFLRGGSDDDNLWQWTGEALTDHLDLLVSAGGNYLRCTMSDRDEGNAYAFKLLDNGKYDLDQWNEEYWNRLKSFLDETEKRDIIVQITCWDYHDFSGRLFDKHPINPQNNMNWSVDLVRNRDDFFYLSFEPSRKEVLDHQERFIRKLLSLTLSYDHVIYNITNETPFTDQWENHWAVFLKREAEKANKMIHVTSMHMSPENSVRHVMTYHDLFTFAEISQNNQDYCGGRHRVHYDNVIYWRTLIEQGPKGPMPINNEKIYGADNYNAGTFREAEERFWKNVFAGSAAVRFHRPTWGIGLSGRALINLKALDMLLEQFDIFSATPYPAVKPVGMSMEAYALANVGKQYAIYFPAGRYAVEFDPWIYANKLKVKWLDIDASEWSKEEIIVPDWTMNPTERLHGYRKYITFWTPSAKPYVAFIEVVD